jgi:Asp-tRNA(Asn)/Glu-tRNA(Gln) amidotransferase A subunit family amidase
LEAYSSPRPEITTGPSADTRIAIKDNIAVSDVAMTCGLREFRVVPDTDASVVTRLLGAGAAVVGKTNMDGFAFGPGGAWSEFEQVTNPRYPSYYPGGSSSGSAAAVAGGLVDAALGSDTGGSIRKPAAYCGLTGIKPSPGIVPRDGFVPLAASLDTIGPLTQDVQTAAELMDVICGRTVRDPHSIDPLTDSFTHDLAESPSVVFGLPDSFFDCAIPEIRDTVYSHIDTLLAVTNSESIEVSLDNSIPADIYPQLTAGEFAALINNNGIVPGASSWHEPNFQAAFREYLAHGFNEHITKRKLPGVCLHEETNGLSYTIAKQTAIEFERAVNAVFDEVDALLTPTIPRYPPPLRTDLDESDHDRSINLKPFNITGSPAVTVPIDDASGLPVSLQIITPRGTDYRALQIAESVETHVSSYHN